MAYEYKGIEYMRRKLTKKRTRALKRYLPNQDADPDTY